MNVWAIVDDRTGSKTQTIGVAQALGKPFTLKQIRYNKWVKLPNFLRGTTLIGIEKGYAVQIKPPFPDVVITSGRRLAPVARYIKKHSPKTRLIHIMGTEFRDNSDFTIVAIPEHDRKQPKGDNILRIPTSPHKITFENLQKDRELWEKRLSELQGPFISVFVGGSSKKAKFTEEMASNLGHILQKLAEENNASILITTSRRTGLAQEKILEETVKAPRYFYKWSDSGENPYFSFLDKANAIVVTGDSMSMISEVVSLGVPVYIYAPDGFRTAKQERLHKVVYQGGLAKQLSMDTKLDFNIGSITHINNSAELIASEFYKTLAL